MKSKEQSESCEASLVSEHLTEVCDGKDEF